LRDFDTVREVARRLKGYKNIEFHIVSSQASILEGLENVTVYNGIEDEKLLELYQHSHVLLLPLIGCTANNALLEGIACGLPVVSSLLPSVKAYLPGQEAELIEGNDPEEFVEALLLLFKNSEKRKQMGQLARKRAEDLDWRKIALQYEAIYSEFSHLN
jgi:glycosyltransferase involved in cell wall biosynthesis